MIAVATSRPIVTKVVTAKATKPKTEKQGRLDTFKENQKQNAKKTGKQLVKAARTFTQDELKRTRDLFSEHRDLFKELFSDSDDVIDAVVVKEDSEKYFE